MKTKRANWLVPALAIGIVGFGLYGFNQQRQRQAMVQMSENHFLRNFHQLTSNLSNSRDALAGTLVTTSAASLHRELSTAMGQVHAASVNLENLPASLLQKGSLIGYLDKTATDLQQLQLRHINGQAFTAGDQQHMTVMYKQIGSLVERLQGLQTRLLTQTKSPRFISALSVQAQDPELQKHFTAFDGAAHQLMQNTQSRPLKTLQNADSSNKYLNTGKTITTNQAVNIATSYLNPSGIVTHTVQNLGRGFPYPGYLVALGNGSHQQERVGVSRHRGIVVFFTKTTQNQSNRAKSSLSELQAQQMAETFLRIHGFGAMTLLRSVSTPQSMSFTFVPFRQGVVIEPQMLLVKVNPYTKMVTDFDASAYYSFLQALPSLQPHITTAQSIQHLSANFHVVDEHLAVVQNTSKQPRLVYEIMGAALNNTFEILVDANTGEQLAIEKINKD